MVYSFGSTLIILIHGSSPRLNYILWLQDLVDATSGGKRDGYDPEREVIGLDVYVFLLLETFNLHLHFYLKRGRRKLHISAPGVLLPPSVEIRWNRFPPCPQVELDLF